MANVLPPPPINDPAGSFVWMEWYRQLRNYISQSGSVPWSVIDFAGSNIADITTRNHNNLQNIQGGSTGNYYHLARVLVGTTTYDFTSIATTATATTNITVTGALTSDLVTLTVQTPTAGIVYDAYVSAIDTVTIRATNIKTTSVDPVSSLYTVRIIS